MPTVSDVDDRLIAICEDIQNGKGSADLYMERAQIFLAKELYSQALEDAKTAISLDSNHIQAYIVAGRLCTKLKKFSECYEFYKEGLLVDPKNPDITEDLKTLQSLIMEEYSKCGENAHESGYNAVTLSSQNIYPGDDQLFKLEIEILTKKYKVKVIQEKQRELRVDLAKRKEAATIGVSAHNCHITGQLQEALYLFTSALAKDETNFRLRHMRAEVYRDLGDKKMAMQDLVDIPKPYRSPEVWKMGGIILAAFELPVMAEFWFRKATTLTPGGKDVEAATLFQKVRVKRTYGPLTEDFAVKVDFTEFGRAVFASEILEEGENAFDDEPVVVGQLLNCIQLPACAHCGKSLITHTDFFGNDYDAFPDDLKAFTVEHWPDVTGVACNNCDREKYCSESCRSEAWEKYHQIICPARNSAANELYDLIENKGYIKNEKEQWVEIWPGQYSPIIIAKMWGIIITEARRLMKSKGETQPTIEHWAKAKMPFRKFIAYSSTSAVKKLPEIFSLMKRLFTDCGDGISYPITESEFDARYYQATCNLQAFSGSVTPRNIFMTTLSKTEDIRSLKMLKYLDKKGPTVSFAGMFPLHACLNHACDNNVEVMDGYVNGKPGVHIRVRRKIKPGEELFTTYIDTAMPRQLRRAWLYKSFNFWCFCKRCQFEGDDNSSCTNCKKAATDGKKFPGCGRCKKAWYCSTNCQKEAWVKGHKSICHMAHSDVHAHLGD